MKELAHPTSLLCRGGEVHVGFGTIEVVDRHRHGVCGHCLRCTEKRNGERESKDRDFGVHVDHPSVHSLNGWGLPLAVKIFWLGPIKPHRREKRPPSEKAAVADLCYISAGD